MDVVIFTVVVIAAFLFGGVLGMSVPRNGKYDGTLEISEKDVSQIHTLEITTEPVDLKNKSSVRFKVKKVPNS